MEAIAPAVTLEATVRAAIGPVAILAAATWLQTDPPRGPPTIRCAVMAGAAATGAGATARLAAISPEDSPRRRAIAAGPASAVVSADVAEVVLADVVAVVSVAVVVVVVSADVAAVAGDAEAVAEAGGDRVCCGIK